MGLFKVRRTLALVAGTVDFGADCNLYRNSANVLKTDDALTVTGALVATGGINASAPGTVLGTFTAYKSALGTVIADAGTLSIKKHLNSGGTTTIDGGTVTAVTGIFSGSSNMGTQVILPYGASAGLTANGDFRIYHGTFLPHFTFKSGGTQYTIALPNSTHGTITCTVGAAPD